VKILMAHKFYYYGGGADKYFLDLISLMEKHGHQVIPFAMQHPRNLPSEFSRYFVSQWDPDTRGLRTKLRNALTMIHSFEAARAIERLVADTKPDIAHLHHIYHQLSSSILRPLRQARVPVVQTVHDYKLVCPNYRLFNPRTGLICEKCMGSAYYHPIFERCLRDSALAGLLGCVEAYWTLVSRIYKRGVDCFTVSNQHMKARLISYGIRPHRIKIIPNFVEARDYTPSYESDGYVLYFGRISREKGILDLVKAMEALPSLELNVVGDGDELSALQGYVRENDMTNVHFLGPAWDEDLKPILARAMLVVVPSVWPENSPLVIYQSFAAGKPVIGSRVGGIPDLIEDGEDGLLFQPRDVEELSEKVAYLARRPKLVREMGRRARDKAERQYDPEVHYQKMMGVYEGVLGGL
jgi:glycosyltransferase involved in cell wall biosynthesis